MSLTRRKASFKSKTTSLDSTRLTNSFFYITKHFGTKNWCQLFIQTLKHFGIDISCLISSLFHYQIALQNILNDVSCLLTYQNVFILISSLFHHQITLQNILNDVSCLFTFQNVLSAICLHFKMFCQLFVYILKRFSISPSKPNCYKKVLIVNLMTTS